MTTPRSGVHSVKKAFLLVGMVVALGVLAPAAHANSRSHRVSTPQTTVQIAINQVWAPIFSFIWGDGNTVVVTINTNQTINQGRVKVVTVGGTD